MMTGGRTGVPRVQAELMVVNEAGSFCRGRETSQRRFDCLLWRAQFSFIRSLLIRP